MAALANFTLRMRIVGVDSVIAAIDAIAPEGDPERAHADLEKILVDALGPDVKDAYDRLVGRSPWWASA